MHRLGYTGLVFLMFLDNVFPPVPSEIIMPSAGYTAALGHLSLWAVIVAGSFGSLLAAALLYGIGRAIPRARLLHWVTRWGKYIGVNTANFEKALNTFEQQGHKVVFFGRMVPAVRSLVSIPAGMSRMPFYKFMSYSAAGTVIWTSFLACLGYYLGQNKQLMLSIIHRVGFVLLALATILIALWFYRKFYKTSSN